MPQHYANHKRFYPLFHFFTIPLTVLGLGLAIYSYVAIPTIITGLIVLAFFLIAIIAVMARMFALKAQDRAARAEEKLRYLILAGKAFPPDLKLGQTLSLRFASDEEYVELVDKSVAENLTPDEIKKAIKNWRGDYHRI
ncbi:hypothetical protein EZ449_17745 [Pedobacter frigidisoli]|uniref:Uncharacterized protein n=1 Tax=Pedobacter frigidisoli TaxID=2530455 RepID=A0A4R0NYI0_9SPHI|nr:DUF6526 family protein [Pedobacter frigidisoli]TCD04154.1 hypothetical protein EZ449_17745 [Pedobacter frigidisoli]